MEIDTWYEYHTVKSMATSALQKDLWARALTLYICASTGEFSKAQECIVVVTKHLVYAMEVIAFLEYISNGIRINCLNNYVL